MKYTIVSKNGTNHEAGRDMEIAFDQMEEGDKLYEGDSFTLDCGEGVIAEFYPGDCGATYLT